MVIEQVKVTIAPWSNVAFVVESGFKAGAPGEIRTRGLRFRKPLFHCRARQKMAEHRQNNADLVALRSSFDPFVGASCTLGKGLKMSVGIARSDRRAGEHHVFRIEELVWSTFGRGYDDLVTDCQETYKALVDTLLEDRNLTRPFAEYIVGRVFEGMTRIAHRGFGGRGKAGVLPAVAVDMLLSAIEVLAEPLPNGRTMQAYRNRHKDFIKSLCELAEHAAGSPCQNQDFYSKLGRKIASAVLEHDLISPPALAPSDINYQRIEVAALEQLVYFIRAGEDGPVKIGIAVQPADRLATLQTGHYERLSLVAITSGGRVQETAYHAHFAAHRLAGEWFAPHPSLLAEIDRLNQEVLG